jgi:hypothetical protein
MDPGDITNEDMDIKSVDLNGLMDDDEKLCCSDEGDEDEGGDVDDECLGSASRAQKARIQAGEVCGSLEDDEESEDMESGSDEDDEVEHENEKVTTAAPSAATKKTKKQAVKKAVKAVKNVIAKTKKPKTERVNSEKKIVKAPKVAKTPKVPKAPKIKKPRTIRRPYKSMQQEFLENKHANTQGRFELLTKRVASAHKLLERLNFEIASRKDDEMTVTF